MSNEMKARVSSLPRRQRQVLRLISLGCTTKQMAAILGLAPPTIDNYRKRLKEHLGVDKMQLLARIAIKHRVSSMDDQLTPAEKRKCGRKQDGWN